MGLDMYLEKKTYVKNWDHMKPEARHEITVLLGGKPRADIKPERITNITERVGYWRKANAIHAWFVHYVQGDKDECQESLVSTEQLQALLDACNTVLADHSQAPALLPTRSGIFLWLNGV